MAGLPLDNPVHKTLCLECGHVSASIHEALVHLRQHYEGYLDPMHKGCKADAQCTYAHQGRLDKARHGMAHGAFAWLNSSTPLPSAIKLLEANCKPGGPVVVWAATQDRITNPSPPCEGPSTSGNVKKMKKESEQHKNKKLQKAEKEERKTAKRERTQSPEF